MAAGGGWGGEWMGEQVGGEKDKVKDTSWRDLPTMGD